MTSRARPGTAEDRGPFPAERDLLVTGAAGFIGRHLVLRLGEAGARVRALDVSTEPRGLDGGGVAYTQADVRDRSALQDAVAGVDTVFHLAAVHLDVHAGAEAFESVNVQAVRALVECCAEAGVRRLIHCSSVGVYGHVANPPAAEDAPKAPQTPYERTKLAGERVALARGQELGLDVVILRPAWVFGPGCPRTAKLLAAVRKRRFVYIGDGSNLRHPLFIDDLVRAFFLAGEAPGSVAGKAYIIGGPRAMTLREMVESCAEVLGVPPPRLRLPRRVGRALGWSAEWVAGLLGREPPLSRRSLAFFENDNAFDVGRAERELGFHASVEFEEGLRRTLAGAAGI